MAVGEPDSGWTAQTLLPRAMRGATMLGLRQVLAALITIVGGVVLARLLSPRDFGYYAIAVVILGFVGSLGDGGLGASLIRERAEPTDEELRAAFTTQLGLSFALALAGWAATLGAEQLFRLPSAGVHLVLLSLAAPLIATLKTVPTIRLERQVRYGVIGVSGVVETIVFNGVAVAGAAGGLGATGFGYGLLAGAAAGAITLSVASPWRPGFVVDVRGMAHHLRFGLPYQGATLVSLFKDSISPLFIGLFIGATQVGYVEWAGRLAAYAVLAMFIVQRLLLSTLARVQHEPAEFDRIVVSALRAANALVAPLAATTLYFAHPLTDLLFGRKWEPALAVFWFLWLANLVAPTATVAFAALNALGESRLTFRFALLWMISTWVLGVPCILAFGFAGFGVANLLVQLTNLWLFKVASRRFALPWVQAAAPPWLIALGAGALGLMAAHLTRWDSYPSLVVGVASSLVAYSAALWLWSRPPALRHISEPAEG